MAKINRSDIIQKAVNDLAISTANDKVPTETLDKVQLTYSLNRKFSNYCATSGNSSSGTLALTLPTLSAGAEFYLCNIAFGYEKDAACDLATGTISVNIVPDNSNTATAIIQIPVTTLTAQRDFVNIVLPYPLKLRNSSQITCAGSFTLGAYNRRLSIVGLTTSSN